MLEILIVLTLFIIFWLVSSRRWKRWFVAPVGSLLLGYLLCTYPPLVSATIAGIGSSLPKDPGTPVDTIVVLGRGGPFRYGRVELAADLWQEKRAPRIFVSGMSDAREIIELLEQRGVPAEAISGETCSQSTQENAVFTTAFLGPQGIKSLLLVTDIPHMRRAFMVFQDAGFTVIPSASSVPAHWPSTAKARLLVREYLGLLIHFFLRMFQPQSPLDLQQPAPEVAHKITTWKCRVSP